MKTNKLSNMFGSILCVAIILEMLITNANAIPAALESAHQRTNIQRANLYISCYKELSLTANSAEII